MSTTNVKIPGPKILLEGPSGTGKTHALGTIVDWAKNQPQPVEVFVIFAENGAETLLGYWRDRGLPVPMNLHYAQIQPESAGFDQLALSAANIGKFDYAMLSKTQDAKRNLDSSMGKFLAQFTNFTDQNGRSCGPIDKTPPNSIICVDSLSALNYFLQRLILGNRPVMAMGEYMVAQKFMMDLLFRCTQNLQQTFILTAHVDRQVDEVMGGIKLMTKAPGNKLSAEIPPLFSEVILTGRDGDKYFWDTANPQADLKSRYLPISSKLPPDFTPIMEKWLIRQGAE